MALTSRPGDFYDVIDGVRLHWSDRGQGDTVVILHGLLDSERTWSRVADGLASRYRVVAIDLPGCGLSDRPNASYSLDWQARLIAGWLDSLAVPSVDIVGHSFGGGVSMWLLLYRAALVRRIALVAPGGLGRDVGVALRLASLPPVEGWGQPWMAASTRILTALHGASLPTEDQEYLCRVNGRAGSSRAFARTVRDVVDYRGQRRHFLDRALEVSTLPAMRLFWGEQDRIIPIEHGEQFASDMRNTLLERFPAQGHFLHWSAPDELTAALLHYLSSANVPRAQLRRGAA